MGSTLLTLVSGYNHKGKPFTAHALDLSHFVGDYSDNKKSIAIFSAAAYVVAACLKTQRQAITRGNDSDRYSNIPAYRISTIDKRYKQAAALSMRIQRDIDHIDDNGIGAYIAYQLNDITDAEVQEYISIAMLSYAATLAICGHNTLRRPGASLYALKAARKAVNAYIHSNKREFYTKSIQADMTIAQIRITERFALRAGGAYSAAYYALDDIQRGIIDYMVNGVSGRDIAKIYGCAVSTMQYRIKKLRAAYTAALPAEMRKKYVG